MAQKKAEDALKQVTEVKDMISTMQSSLKEVCTAVGAIGEIQTTLKSVSDSFAVFSEKINSKIDNLSVRTDEISQRVDAVDKSIREDVKLIEGQLEGGIQNVQTEIDEVKANVANNKVDSNEKISALEKELSDTRRILDTHMKKYVSLEKAFFRSNKHSREWNEEIDGIPTNVGDDADQLKEAVYELCHSINVDIEE